MTFRPSLQCSTTEDISAPFDFEMSWCSSAFISPLAITNRFSFQGSSPSPSSYLSSNNNLRYVKLKRARLCRRRYIQVPSAIKSFDTSDAELIDDLNDDGSTRQILALLTISKIPSERALKIIHNSTVLSSKYRKTRIAILDLLGKLKDPSELSTLTNALENDDDHSIRAAAAGGLSELLIHHFDADACTSLRQAAINDDHFIVRYSAIVALGNIADLNAVTLFIPLIQNINTPALEVAAAIDALGEILSMDDVTDTYIQSVISRIDDNEDLIRAAVVRTLVRWKSHPLVASTLSSMLRAEVERGHSSFVLSLLQQLLNNDDAK